MLESQIFGPPDNKAFENLVPGRLLAIYYAQCMVVKFIGKKTKEQLKVITVRIKTLPPF